MAPLWYARADGMSALRDGILRGPAKRPRMLTALLAIQGALTVVLLVGAGLFLRSLHNAQTEDLGLDRDNVLAVQIDFSGTGRPAADIAAFFERALERASTVPGVSQASLTLSVPLRSARRRIRFGCLAATSCPPTHRRSRTSTRSRPASSQRPACGSSRGGTSCRRNAIR